MAKQYFVQGEGSAEEPYTYAQLGVPTILIAGALLEGQDEKHFTESPKSTRLWYVDPLNRRITLKRGNSQTPPLKQLEGILLSLSKQLDFEFVEGESES